MPKAAARKKKTAQAPRSEGQLLANTVPVDNPKVRDELVRVIDEMARLDESRRAAAGARRKFDEIVGTWAEGLADGDAVDVIVGEKYFVRLVARKRDARKATKPGLTVSKKWHPMPESRT
jgi:hypothetical protein